MTEMRMPPDNTTFMGVLRGALDYHRIETDAATVFGMSGHAFLINIHDELCPSGPYCWRRDAMTPLIRNLGLVMTDLGFFSPTSSPADRARVEQRLRQALDSGIPCSLINLENQLIAGYDAEGLNTLQPWAPHVDFPPARLSFGSWPELGDSFHVNFYTLERAEPVGHRQAALAALEYAVDLHANPTRHSLAHYGIGPDAYAHWINAVPEHGTSHGNWWNATVWSECRRMASRFVADLGQQYPDLAPVTGGLAKAYDDIGALLYQVSDKTMEAGQKVALLAQARDQEAAAIAQVAVVAASLR